MRKLLFVIIALGILTGCDKIEERREIDRSIIYQRGYWTVAKLNDSVVVCISAENDREPIIVNINNLKK